MSADESKPDAGEAGQKAAELQKQTQDDAQNRKRLEKAIGAAQKVVESQKQAESLKDRALKAVNPKERMNLLKEAYQKEVEAHGQSKLAKRLQSGVWQGGAAGGGIGAGIAMGLGTITGTLVTGVAAIPTVLIGGLVGAGTGAIHGSWFKLPDFSGDKKGQQMSEEEIREKAMKEAEALDQAVEKGASTVPQPPSGFDEMPDADGRASPVSERRKPRKLQVRSGSEASAAPERKKPRKLEVRSAAERNGNA